MSYNFLPYDQDQFLLMPPSLNEWVAEGSLARFVSDLVDDLDGRGKLAVIYGKYRADGWGRASYNPRMMVKIILLGYVVGVRSSRKLAGALNQDVRFRYLAANQTPDFRTISDFRKENLAELESLFVEILELCKEAGLVKMGVVAMDGRKVAGNAAIERNRSRRELEKLVKRMLQEAEETDAREDELFGRDKRGDELPDELQTKAGRKKRIQEAIEQIEALKKQAEEEQAKRVQEWEEAAARGERKKGKKPSLKPRKRKLDQIEKFKANPTDPESRVMKTRRGWVQGYNGQVAVDCESQVIVAHVLTNEADDCAHLPVLLKCCEEQAGARPEKGLLDAGYWSAANAALSDEHTELFIAVERESRMSGRVKVGTKQSPPEGPEAEAMRRKLTTEDGRNTYKKRSKTVEPVFGQMSMRDLNRFLLRGIRKAAGEWSLFSSGHNILKLFRSGWWPQVA